MKALTLRAAAYSARVERRTLTASAALVAAAPALGVTGLCQGAVWATPVEVVRALAGQGDAVVVITEWRLPRVAAALVFGASLGLAGAVFQNLTRNPLGSPDVIGLDAGAYTGTLVAITLLGGTAAQLAACSVAGGLLAAAAIYTLSRGAGLAGLRLVVIGIAVNAILTAVNSWIVLRAELDVAIAATGWSAGSLNGVGWQDVRLPFAVIGLLMIALLALAHAMQQAALGDDVAVTTGVGGYRPKAVAREVGFLPQGLVAPENIVTRRLVARGRYPHQSPLSTWSPQDERAVEEAMAAAGVADLADRPVAELSGGQRQRVWMAMVLAQETRHLLLDEPTTFLDIAHQYQLPALLARLREQGRTIVAVLHDINQACRYADHIVAMRDGRIAAQGPRPPSWTRRWSRRSSACRAWSCPTPSPARRWWCLTWPGRGSSRCPGRGRRTRAWTPWARRRS
ncbi:ABC-type enterobactin transport system permease subunit [Thermocatellispora tengchongensis]|uniref:ABC-type enterobactin transport system permease subunit n=1 Tax=Thermocatellispora tengchongensis TaxID=1073253 RepID=A0A840PBE8_9ACTN|nr:ABC-type enterobactin transport system permease subunit [Thermocatellispora tengchongensis]